MFAAVRFAPALHRANGLVAEEVAQVFPELAVRDTNGDVETVHYETLNVLLLNELQKQEQLNEKQQGRIEALERRLTELLRRLGTLEGH